MNEPLYQTGKPLNDWFSLRNMWWRAALFVSFCIVLTIWLWQSGMRFFAVASFGIGLLLIKPLDGEFVYRVIGKQKRQLMRVLRRQPHIHKDARKTAPITQPSVSPEIELEYVVVTGNGKPQVVPFVLSPAGEVHYLFMKSSITQPKDPLNMDPEDRKIWEDVMQPLINRLGQEGVHNFTLMEWRVPHDTTEADSEYARTLDDRFRQAFLDPTKSLLSEAEQQALERDLKFRNFVTLGTYDTYNVLAITIKTKRAWGKKNRPTEISYSDYQRTRIYRLKRDISRILKQAGKDTAYLPPLELSTLLRVVMEPSKARQFYRERERDRNIWANDIMNSPTVSDSFNPQLVAPAGPGIRTDSAQHVVRWMKRFRNDFYGPGVAHSMMIGGGADSVAFVSHAVLYVLSPARLSNFITQSTIFNRTALRSGGDRLVSEQKQMTEEEQADEHRRRVRAKQRWLVDHTRYLVASTAYNAEDITEMDETLKSNADGFAETKPVALEDDRWPALLTSLYGFHLHEH